jgi:hypothetical protein
MKFDVTELTNEGKRNLLQMLCDELTYAEISKLVKPFSDRLEVDEMGEPYIVLKDTECSISYTHKLWIDINDVVTETVDSESDYE